MGKQLSRENVLPNGSKKTKKEQMKKQDTENKETRKQQNTENFMPRKSERNFVISLKQKSRIVCEQPDHDNFTKFYLFACGSTRRLAAVCDGDLDRRLSSSITMINYHNIRVIKPDN